MRSRICTCTRTYIAVCVCIRVYVDVTRYVVMRKVYTYQCIFEYMCGMHVHMQVKLCMCSMCIRVCIHGDTWIDR